MFTQF